MLLEKNILLSLIVELERSEYKFFLTFDFTKGANIIECGKGFRIRDIRYLSSNAMIEVVLLDMVPFTLVDKALHILIKDQNNKLSAED